MKKAFKDLFMTVHISIMLNLFVWAFCFNNVYFGLSGFLLALLIPIHFEEEIKFKGRKR